MSAVIKSVGVIGTGVIGASWVGLFLSRGLQVYVSDPDPKASEKLAKQIDNMWPTLEAVGLSAGASRSNYKFVGASLKEHLEKLDFIQENAPENIDVKTKLFAEIDAGTKEGVVIASSSSGIPSSKFIQGCKKDPGRILIGHPFNPPHLMPLVEVVPHHECNKEAVEGALDFYTSLGQRPVLIKKEVPGFAANRLQAAVNQEAFSLVQRGILSASDLDTCMTTGLGLRWALTGPFMTGVLGGGGGKDGFRHLMEHLGPAAKTWLDDMRANEYQYTDENLNVLEKSVNEELSEHDVTEVNEQRDRVMVKLLREKAKASALV